MLQSGLRATAATSLVTVLLIAAPAWGRTLTINFDQGPDGAPVLAGDELSDLYAPQGVTFSTIDNGGTPGGCDDDGGVYAADDRGSEAPEFGSSPNVVTLCSPGSFASDFTEIIGEIVAEFTRDAERVCINVIPGDGVDRGWLKAYALGGIIATDTATSTPGAAETICVSAEDDAPAIRSVRFSAPEDNPVRYARFDDLRITFAPLVIDFDLDADGVALLDGDDLATRYESQGVVFDKAAGTGTCGDVDTVYARSDGPVGFGSAPNVVSACNSTSSEFSEDTHGWVRATLLAAAVKVCVLSRPDPGARGALSVYDAEGDLIETVKTDVGVEQEICVQGGPIRVVEFAGDDVGEARFDDLAITFGGAQANFDVDPLAQTIEAGSAVNVTYQTSGITFERTSGSNCGAEGMVYANDDHPGDFGSLPNVVSLCETGASDFSENLFGMVRAVFLADATAVCVDVNPTESDDFAVLEAYDVDETLIEEVESAAGLEQILCIAAPGIRSVQFAGAGDKFARFDDLTAAVPEPGGAALAAASLVAIAALRRSRG